MIDITLPTNKISLTPEITPSVLHPVKKSNSLLIVVCVLIFAGILLYLYLREQEAKKDRQ